VRRGGEIEHNTDMRGSKHVQAPDCGAPTGPSDFAAELTFLSFFPIVLSYRLKEKLGLKSGAELAHFAAKWTETT
jgi:hypothetical protein